MNRHITGAIGVAALLTLSSCSAGRTSDSSARARRAEPTTASVTPAAPTTTGIPVPRRVPEILDFTAPTVAGGEIHGADYAGRALALWFWAPW